MDPVVGIIGVVALAWLVLVAVRGASSPRRRFRELGSPVGRTTSEVLAVVGLPSSRSSVGPDRHLLQWLGGGFHVALMFDGDVCVGVVHEASTR